MPHPYRAVLKAELDEMTNAVLAELDEGAELPLDADVIDRAVRRVAYRSAAERAAREGRTFLAWMIRRAI